jgi:glycosyltransferase involved in cell wall biosynthesis
VVSKKKNHSVQFPVPLKIIHIISADLWAGAAVQVYNTLRFLSKQDGVSITCILFNDGVLKKKLARQNIETILLDETEQNSISMLFQLIKIFRKIGPHIIHVHATKEHFLGKFSSVLSFNNSPIVRTVHGIMKVPSNLSFFKFIRASLVVYFNRILLTKMTDALVAVSQELENKFLALKIKGKVFQIYNAIDMEQPVKKEEKVYLKQKYRAFDNFWVGTAARLEEPKNLGMLIKAAEYLREKEIFFKISIFGNGSKKKELQLLINKFNLNEYVEIHDFEVEILPVIANFDVFVICSFTEGLPMALLEAMLLKVPLICTAVGGMKEIIQDKVNGLLVPSGDSKMLAEAVFRLYQDRGMAAKLANNAYEMVTGNFSIQHTGSQLLDLYQSILN